MFVKRKPSRIPPGRKDRQIYVPHKQMQIVQPPLEIRTKADALFYYNELKRLGYIVPPTPPSPNNAIYATLGSSNGSFIEFVNDNNQDLIVFTGNDLEDGAIEPAPIPGQAYDIQFLGGLVVPFVTISGNAESYWHGHLSQDYNDIKGQYMENISAARTVGSWSTVTYANLLYNQQILKVVICIDRQGWSFDIFDITKWRIDLTPVQTYIRILMAPVNQ